jgi:hypothetical protein
MVRTAALVATLASVSTMIACSHTVEGQGPIQTTSPTEPRAAAGEACECVSSTDDPRGDESCCEAGFACRSATPVTCNAAGCSRSGVCVEADD